MSQHLLLVHELRSLERERINPPPSLGRLCNPFQRRPFRRGQFCRTEYCSRLFRARRMPSSRLGVLIRPVRASGFLAARQSATSMDSAQDSIGSPVCCEAAHAMRWWSSASGMLSMSFSSPSAG